MPVTRETRSVTTPDGACPVHLFQPDGAAAPGPAVVLFMDAGGIRPTILDMAEDLARHGLTVAVPNLYYRAGPYPPADAKAAFEVGPEQARLRRLAATMTPDGLIRDLDAVLGMLEAGGATAIGCVGYCMGGHCALVAAGAHGARVAAAASIHGARLATDLPGSPHGAAAAIRGEVYVAVAEVDPYFDDAERTRLAEALTAAGVRHTIEVYDGARHGFAVPDNPTYDEAAAARHRTQVLALFDRALRPRA